jgi:hypothetical protein
VNSYVNSFFDFCKKMTYRPFQFEAALREVPKFIPIMSVNHDFVPTEMGGMPKVWWVELNLQAPQQLRIGMQTIVRVSYMTSQFVRDALHNKLFVIGDIIGTRIMLVPAMTTSHINPSLHHDIASYLGTSSGYPFFKKSPFGWGLATSYPTALFKPDQFQIKYGVGPPVAYLEMI